MPRIRAINYKRFSLLLLVVMLLSSCSKLYDSTTTIPLAHTLDVNHPVHLALLHMDKRLQELSSGQMKLKIFPSGQLGTEREILELVQIGSLGMTKVSASPLEAFVPKMKVFSLPYLFNNNKHYWDTLNGEVGKRLLNEGTAFRIKGLGYFDAGSRSFYSSDNLIKTPDDLNGMKIRVMNSQSAVDMVNTIGGSATPVSFGELYTALQQGVVDGAENNPPSFYFSKHFEVSKYYLLDEHTSIPDVIIIGTHIWNNLNSQQQDWLTQAMSEATDYQRVLWKESTEQSLKAVKEAGVEIIVADKKPFQESVKPIYDNLKDEEIITLVDEIKLIGELP
ncbi:TRAP transporter substrate-binding protein [Aliiglaciecola sp. 3_MG-2023]|uniref:TRAP transporter substrate-binding protein n=1 Tax=Aliiglaciecola sp. 3_MG-2023 TaxID=3062644 RepID=UPI0026E246FE|nr:TRAP transporter substrate-binding protein [Aliiglaciecola sp. 3_MG-2023]MDO6693328.1 TRAP transporter substrate-binding protein [Aliiglaciecola sp. 3_MG-2023]